MSDKEWLIEKLYEWGNKENDGVRAESIADYLLEICRERRCGVMSNKITIKEVECFKEFDICLGEKVIGTAEIKYPEMTLNNFKIYSEYQNKGYGQKAIKQFVNDFGVTNLWVDPQNEVAKHIYEKNGFVVDGTPLFIAMRVKGGAE